MKYRFSSYKVAFLTLFLGFSFCRPLLASINANDSLIVLEAGLLDRIHKTKSLLNDIREQIKSNQVQMAEPNLTKKQTKLLERESKNSMNSLNLNQKSLQAYLILLSETRNLKYLNDKVKSKKLTKIKDVLKNLDKGKTPKHLFEHSLSDLHVARLPIQVYDTYLSSPCELQFDENGSIWANAYRPFFEYTDARISKFFKEDDFLECWSRFIYSNKKYYLELKFVLHSPKASQIYGSIDPSNPARLDFMNGDFIYLETFALNTSEIEPGSANTIYTIQYKLDNEDLRYLSKYDVDSFTIIWTNGADRFELLYLDVLKTMLECLKERS